MCFHWCSACWELQTEWVKCPPRPVLALLSACIPRISIQRLYPVRWRCSLCCCCSSLAGLPDNISLLFPSLLPSLESLLPSPFHSLLPSLLASLSHTHTHMRARERWYLLCINELTLPFTPLIPPSFDVTYTNVEHFCVVFPKDWDSLNLHLFLYNLFSVTSCL